MRREGHNKPSTDRKQPDQKASGGDALDDFTELEGHCEHEYRLRKEHSSKEKARVRQALVRQAWT